MVLTNAFWCDTVPKKGDAMNRNADAISFVRNHLKYRAAKRYVAMVSAGAINRLWQTMNQTEYTGIPFKFYCGHIDINILRNAFLRELSYNPLRFKSVQLDDRGRLSRNNGDIVDSIYRVLDCFAVLWPNGIHGYIGIMDTSDDAYRFLRDLRDCFKAIARQNISDFKQAEYRDEILARFANASDINMADDIRIALRQITDETAWYRTHRRIVADLRHRISVLDNQIRGARAHDREFCAEMRAEQERLVALLNDAIAAAKSKTKPRPARIDIYDSASGISDAAEREDDLLRSMTSEHKTDEIFQDCVERTVGVRLAKYRDGKQY